MLEDSQEFFRRDVIDVSLLLREVDLKFDKETLRQGASSGNLNLENNKG